MPETIIGRLPERYRRAVASWLQWIGWVGSLALIFHATVAFDPNHGDFPPAWYGPTVILLVGVAIAATTARSRMRLTDTIRGAFETGLKAAEEAAADRLAKVELRHENEDWTR